MGRLRKKAAGKARKPRGMRCTSVYAAMTKDEAQRSIRTFYEAVKIEPLSFPIKTKAPVVEKSNGGLC